jgi:catechol 2,3-dioxygenase-like lactoylglutathione lyase family enzyme
MSRVQLALNVEDLDAAVTFYSKLFGTEPAKTRPGYANFAVANPPLKLVLLENPGRGGTLNHLGVEVESTDVVDSEHARLADLGLAIVEQRETTCCYATQDKFWVEGSPSGEQWEIYTVLADSQTFFDESCDSPAACCATNDEASDESAQPLIAQDRVRSGARYAAAGGPELSADALGTGDGWAVARATARARNAAAW